MLKDEIKKKTIRRERGKILSQTRGLDHETEIIS
jgi:hypothetical protein